MMSLSETEVLMWRQPRTNEKMHHCTLMPGGADIRFKGKRHVSEFSSGFELIFRQRIKEGKLAPKLYEISYGINFCPFCGEKLISRTHDPGCKCCLCEIDKVMNKK